MRKFSLPPPGYIADPVFPKAPPRWWPSRKIMLLAATILLLLGFFAGRGFQHLKNGYELHVLHEERFPFPEGEITRRTLSEGVGFQFLDTEKYEIQLAPRSVGGPPRILYKAQRGFQELTPAVHSLRIEDHRLHWDDGEYRYALEIQKLPPDQPKSPTTATPPAESAPVSHD